MVILNNTPYFTYDKWKPMVFETRPDLDTDYHAVEFLEDGRLLVKDNFPSIPRASGDYIHYCFRNVYVGDKVDSKIMQIIKAHPEITGDMLKQLCGFKIVPQKNRHL